VQCITSRRPQNKRFRSLQAI